MTSPRWHLSATDVISCVKICIECVMKPFITWYRRKQSFWHCESCSTPKSWELAYSSCWVLPSQYQCPFREQRDIKFLVFANSTLVVGVEIHRIVLLSF
jgi:hypothetical protein